MKQNVLLLNCLFRSGVYLFVKKYIERYLYVKTSMYSVLIQVFGSFGIAKMSLYNHDS